MLYPAGVRAIHGKFCYRRGSEVSFMVVTLWCDLYVVVQGGPGDKFEREQFKYYKLNLCFTLF